MIKSKKGGNDRPKQTTFTAKELDEIYYLVMGQKMVVSVGAIHREKAARQELKLLHNIQRKLDESLIQNKEQKDE